jgi:phosphate transport system permease protein
MTTATIGTGTARGAAVASRPEGADRPIPRRRRARGPASLLAAGEPLLWLTGGGMVICLAMIVGLLALVAWQGFSTFWPAAVVRVETLGGATHVGEVTRDDDYQPGEQAFADLPDAARDTVQAAVAASGGTAHRRLIRTGNFDLTGEHFNWEKVGVYLSRW